MAMINLEWLRTFRTVYKTESLTRAAEKLMITQPAVSQHIAALEAYAGKKLFERKSNGVKPTNYAKILNNMVANSFDDLEEVESSFNKKSIGLKTIINIGISEHLYKTVLSEKLQVIGDYVHVKFGEQESLIKEVEEGSLMMAIIPQIVNTFDTICYPLFKQKLILVSTRDINIAEFDQLYKENKKLAERWLSKQDWYSHRPITPFIKQYWLDVFDKKRPTIVPKYIIPNEYEALQQLSKGRGMAIALDTNAKPFLDSGELHSSSFAPDVERDLSLLVNKKKEDRNLSQKIIKIFS